MSSINSKVPPLRLRAVDTPTDGQIPSYQASSGEFEWVDDSSGAPADAEYLLAFDATIPSELTAARKLTVGGNISLTHGAGANDDVQIYARPSGSDSQIQFNTTVGSADTFNANSGLTYNATDEKLKVGNASIVTSNAGKVSVVQESADTGAAMYLQKDEDGAGSGPNLVFYRNSASPANDDAIGRLGFNGEDSIGGERTYARITGEIEDVTSGANDGRIVVETIKAGTQTEQMQIDSAGIKFNNAYTFPTADGNANEVLQTNGSGTLSFAAASGGGLDTTPNIMQTQLPTSGSNLLQFPLFAQFGYADTTSNSVVQFNTTTAVLFPFFAPKTGDVQSITCKIAATNVDDILVSMYNSDSDNLPNTRIGDEATWDMGTSGEVTLDVSGLTDTWDLTAGSLYYLAMMLKTDTTNRPTFYTYDAQDGGGHNTNLPTNDSTTATYSPGNAVLKLSSLSAALPSSVTTSNLTGHRPPFYRVPMIGVVM